MVIKLGWHKIFQEEVTFELDCNRLTKVIDANRLDVEVQNNPQ